MAKNKQAQKNDSPYGAVLECEGQNYGLRFDINACADLEVALGKSISEIISELVRQKKISALGLIEMVGAGIKHQNPMNSRTTAKEIIDELGFENCYLKIVEAINNSSLFGTRN